MAPVIQAIRQMLLRSFLLEISVLLSMLPWGRCMLNTSIYGLNAPWAGCQANWFEVDVVIYFESLSTRTAISDPLSANIHVPTNDSVQIRFCVWNGTENPVPPTPAAHDSVPEGSDISDYDMDGFMFKNFIKYADRTPGYVNRWPPGKYCIYNVGQLEVIPSLSWSYGSCPEGFESGTSSYPFTAYPSGYGTSRYSPLGPAITHSNRSSIDFCCSQPEEGQRVRPISLPFVRPFYLLPVGDKECQPVRGAEVRLDWIQWPHLDYESGLHPYYEEGPHKNGTQFFMCYYVPNAHTLISVLTYIVTIGSVVLSISLFLLLGWCNRKRLAWEHSRMLSLQHSGYNKNDYV